MNIRRLTEAAILLTAAGVLAACNASGHAAAPTTLSVPSSPSVAIHPSLVLTPAEPYPNQAIRVTATGFRSQEKLVITECANGIASTGKGKCALSAIKSVTANASGKVQAVFTPTEGPFGTNQITCTTPRSCLISLSQPTPHSALLAAAPLTFCPPSKTCRPSG